VTAQPETKRRRLAPRWLTIDEAAEYARLSSRTIRQWIHDGNLRAFIPRGSRVVRIDQRDLEDALRGRDARRAR
jgi:excisionase family DNA binding protein